jgi:hypothetical protein
MGNSQNKKLREDQIEDLLPQDLEKKGLITKNFTLEEI